MHVLSYIINTYIHMYHTYICAIIIKIEEDNSKFKKTSKAMDT